METTSLVLALWENGFLNEPAVITWADKQIKDSDSPSDFLIQLSLLGPKKYIRHLEPHFPRPRPLSFKERFALRATRLTLNNKSDVKTFVEWVASAAMGNDLDDPLVIFGYQVEELWTVNDITDAIRYVRTELPKLSPLYKPIADEINEKVA
jgi:hypothetical protein